MYKLVLCLRYLRRRALAYFAVAGVALCVAMMLIVISVMTSFVDKVEQAAKGLFSDVIVESGSIQGIGRYDEFIEELKQKMPDEVAAASPFILTYGILQVPGSDYQQTVQIAGIRLPQRADVSTMARGLHYQAGNDQPTFDPPFDEVLRRIADDGRMLQTELRQLAESSAELPPQDARLAERIRTAMEYHMVAEQRLQQALPDQQELRRIERQYERAVAEGGESDEAIRLGRRLDALIAAAGVLPPRRRAILGLGIEGLSLRLPDGQVVRFIVPGWRISLSLLPLGRPFSSAEIAPIKETFTVIDDCSTDVYSIDTTMVYVPFETLQRLCDMGPIWSADAPPRLIRPARCSQIHIKVAPPFNEGESLQQVRAKIDGAWSDFARRWPDAIGAYEVSVETWRQRQGKLIAQIENQRLLTVLMFAVISFVAILLIFVIFYMMVYQKTRDIGVLKAVGASSSGVAAIFLLYGGAVGLVGSILGAVGGYYFVHYINPIHEWMGRWFGFQPFSREWFLFEKIPNEVQPATVVAIVVAAVLAGLLGALIPALRAARMQPVEALRYE